MYFTFHHTVKPFLPLLYKFIHIRSLCTSPSVYIVATIYRGQEIMVQGDRLHHCYR